VQRYNVEWCAAEEPPALVMSLGSPKGLVCRALWPARATYPLALQTLPLYIVVACLPVLPLQAAPASNALFESINMPDLSATADAAFQGAVPPAVAGDAPAASPKGQTTARTAQQWMAEGLQAQKAGKQSEAIADFLNAQRLDPTSPDPLYSVGMSFFLIGWYENDTNFYDRADRNFKAAIKLDPKHDRAIFMVGTVEVIHSRLEEAEPYVQKAIALNPQNPFYHLHYGILLGRMDEYDQAVAQMLLAEKLLPAYPQAYLSLGQLYAQMRKYPEARSQLERAVQLDPKLAPAYYTLGGVYRHLGMNTESQSAYKAFQERKTTQPKADALLETMQGSTSKSSK
jgi:tetratricopeptide (TPR) repeat protein